MSDNTCSICHCPELIELEHIDKFPIYFGPISPDMVTRVDAYPLTIAICSNCSFIQQVSRLDESILDNIYTAEYYDNPSPIVNQRGKDFADAFCDFFRKCNLPPGKMLEIACFDGYILEQCRNDGWDVYGCDPSSMTQIAMKNIGEDKITNGFFTGGTYPAEEFDVIIVRNFLEHVYDLYGFMQAVSKTLKKNGRAIIEVPNMKVTIENGIFGTFFHQHVSYFTSATISFFLSKCGYSIEKCDDSHRLMICAKKQSEQYDSGSLRQSQNESYLDRNKFLESNREIVGKIRNIFASPQYQSIALFGASAQTAAIIGLLDSDQVGKIKYIFDSDSLKHGKSVYGCDVIIKSPDSIHESNFDVLVITTSYYQNEIYRQLVSTAAVELEKIILLY